MIQYKKGMAMTKVIRRDRTGTSWAIASFTLLSAAVPALAVAAVPPGSELRHRPYIETFKDMALSTCVARAYAAAPKVKSDGEAAASGYLEFGDFDVERGGEPLAALINRYLDRRYGSFQGPSVKLNMMKCIDLYHSDELDALGRRYVLHPRQSYEREHPAGQ